MAIADFALGGQPFFDANGRIFTEPIVGGSNSRRFMPMWAVEASLGANADVWLYFICQSAASSTLKLELIGVADATTGVARVNVSWAAATMPENFDSLSLTAEGAQSITWAAGEDEEFKSTKITLDAATAPAAGQMLVVQVRFETSSWTLSDKSYWSAHLIDE